MTLTTTALVAAVPVNRPSSPATALVGCPAAVGTAVTGASPARFLRTAPIGVRAGETSVDFWTGKPKGDVRTDVQAVTGAGTDARRTHIEKYVPGIPPRGRPV
jgi:hypothetical protein